MAQSNVPSLRHTDRHTDRVKTIPRNPLRGRGNDYGVRTAQSYLILLLKWEAMNNTYNTPPEYTLNTGMFLTVNPPHRVTELCIS